jgi:hypothetical protein
MSEGPFELFNNFLLVVRKKLLNNTHFPLFKSSLLSQAENEMLFSGIEIIEQNNKQTHITRHDSKSKINACPRRS